jgi:signal transduction histidine kinase
VTSAPPEAAPAEPAPAEPAPAEPAPAEPAPAEPAPAEPATAPLPVTEPAEAAGWVVLARPRAERPAEEPASLRRVLFPVALAALVVAVIVAIGGSVVSQRIAESEAVHDVAVLTDDLADSVVSPALTNAMPGDPAQARRVLDPLVRHWLRDGSMVRVKVWTPAGMVLYSDEPRLIGETFALEPGARSALVSPRTDADVSDLRLPENRFERGDGKLLEVYRPVWTPDGQPLLFETYFRYDVVSQRSHQLWRAFGGVMLSSLLALIILLSGVGWLLLIRSRRVRAERERMMERALAASDEERRRIAATLHDGVVQQLVAASFIAAGQAQHAAADGDESRAESLQSVAATVRDSVAGLRSLLVDIYPPSLRSAGLASALHDLASGASGHGAAVVADVDAEVADAAPEKQQEVMFRIAQEALRNALRHAEAGHITLRLAAGPDEASPDQAGRDGTGLDGAGRDGAAVLEVIDDGRGFDGRGFGGTGAAAGGHFGLRLMTDAATHGGGQLALLSAPGAGTRIRYQAGSA